MCRVVGCCKSSQASSLICNMWRLPRSQKDKRQHLNGFITIIIFLKTLSENTTKSIRPALLHQNRQLTSVPNAYPCWKKPELSGMRRTLEWRPFALIGRRQPRITMTKHPMLAGVRPHNLHSSPPWAAITAKAKRLIGLFLPSTDWEDDGARTCVCNAFCCAASSLGPLANLRLLQCNPRLAHLLSPGRLVHLAGPPDYVGKDKE